MVWNPESNVNYRFRSLTAVRGPRISREEHAQFEREFAWQQEVERKVAADTVNERKLVEDTEAYIAYLREAKAKGRTPRLARKKVRERVLNLRRAGNFGRK